MTSRTIDHTALIPEYLNGLLSSEEAAQFEAALGTDADLQTAFEGFKEIQNLYQQDTIGKPVIPSDDVFNRIMAEIDTNEKIAEQSDRQITYSPTLSVRLTEAWYWFKDSLRIPWGLTVVQAAVIILLLIPRIPDSSYKTLGQTSAINDDTHLSFNIVFQESARESDIRKLLLPINGSIVSGPSQQGRYQVIIPHETTEGQVLSILKQSELILFVEKSY